MFYGAFVTKRSLLYIKGIFRAYKHYIAVALADLIVKMMKLSFAEIYLCLVLKYNKKLLTDAYDYDIIIK